MNPEEVSRVISEFLQTRVSVEQTNSIFEYFELLEEWNRKLNLIRHKGWDDFLYMHILDSISPLKWGLIKKHDRMCDIGTGGGLPGIPIKILLPNVEIVLVDSRKKKIQAVEDIVRKLKFTGISTVWGRVEEITDDWKGKFDVATARAVGSEQKVVKMTLPLLKSDGICIVYGTDEKRDAKLAGIETRKGVYRYSFKGLRKDRILKVFKKGK